MGTETVEEPEKQEGESEKREAEPEKMEPEPKEPGEVEPPLQGPASGPETPVLPSSEPPVIVENPQSAVVPYEDRNIQYIPTQEELALYADLEEETVTLQ